MKRRELIWNLTGLGITGAVFAPTMSIASSEKGKIKNDWHGELTNRIAELEKIGGGTLELKDGIYEISKPLRLLTSVSLVLSPNAIIRAKQGFDGDAVVIKGGGSKSKLTGTSGWIKGGVIDGGKQLLTGLRVEGEGNEGNVARLEIADLLVTNAMYKGIHFLKGGYEKNLTRVRCQTDMDTPYTPGSIGIHYENGDNKIILAHVIGYETGVRSDLYSNWFTAVHVWNSEKQGAMPYCFYCNSDADTYNQCYADSFTIAGFYVSKARQSFTQCRLFYSRWAKDNSGVGFMITPEGKDGNYIGNALYGRDEHRLAKAFEGELAGATILGNSAWWVVAGLENRIPSGESSSSDSRGRLDGSFEYPPLTLAGNGFRLTQQTKIPLPVEGDLGEVRWIDDGNASALWVKTSKGWKKSELS